jgi:hypothetical protein
VAFDLGQPKSSISGETNKCLLHLWSPERNMGAEAATFRSQQEIGFGVGAEECVLEDRNFQFFVQPLTAILTARGSTGYSGCIPNAGWSRWSWATSAAWMSTGARE